MRQLAISKDSRVAAELTEKDDQASGWPGIAASKYGRTWLSE